MSYADLVFLTAFAFFALRGLLRATGTDRHEDDPTRRLW